MFRNTLHGNPALLRAGLVACLLISAAAGTLQAATELRGAWLARDSFISRRALAEAMETLARNNFNVAYVNVWSRGYPLWKSRVFEKHTGILTDPGFGGRDILAEALAEGHRVGIEVEAWFEYGFVAGWDGYLPGKSGKGPLFDVHPDWLARSRNGSDAFPIAGGGTYYWMIHTRPEVQQFLIDLVKEVATQYDVDGVEFDRARYPQTDCGYDDFTRALYKQEKGHDPPSSPDDPEWMRWRADNLNLFVGALYRVVKSARPQVTVSNAPIVYPYGYINFLQDYPAWISSNAVDLVAPQVYRDTNTAYASELQNQLSRTDTPAKLCPGIKASSPVSAAELVAMIRTTRAAALPGAVLWYYGSLGDKFAALKSEVYQDKAEVPYRDPSWARSVVIIDENGSESERTGTWDRIPFGWNNDAVQAAGGSGAAIRYWALAPRTAWYEAHAYVTPLPGNAAAAVYRLRDSGGVERSVSVDQRSAANDGWIPLGKIRLKQGERTAVIDLAASGSAAGERVQADAVMLVESHLEPASARADYMLQDNGSRRISPVSGGTGSSAGHAAARASQGDAPSGLATFRTYAAASSGRIQTSAAGVPASVPLRKAALFAEIGTLTNSGLALSNPSGGIARISVTLRGMNGNVIDAVGPGPLDLMPGRQRAFFAYEVFSKAPSPMLGSLWLEADAPVACVTLRGSTNARGEFVITTMPQADLESAPTAGPRIFPQIVDGGGYTVQIWLLNPTDTPLEGSIALFDRDGKPLAIRTGGALLSSWSYSLPPRGIQQWASAGDSSLRTGYAILTPSTGNSIPLASCVFSFLQNSGTRTEVGVPASAPATTSRLHVRRANFGGLEELAGLAVANPGSSSARINLLLFMEDGVRIAGRAERTLKAGEQFSAYLQDWIAGLPPSFEGMLVVSSDEPVASLGLQGMINSRDDYMLSVTASVNAARAPLRAFPHIPIGADYSTDIVLISPGSGIARGALEFLLSSSLEWLLSIF